MLTLYPDSMFIGAFIGWLAAWYCKDLYDHPRKKRKNKKVEPETFKFNHFKNNRFQQYNTKLLFRKGSGNYELDFG